MQCVLTKEDPLDMLQVTGAALFALFNLLKIQKTVFNLMIIVNTGYSESHSDNSLHR